MSGEDGIEPSPYYDSADPAGMLKRAILKELSQLRYRVGAQEHEYVKCSSECHVRERNYIIDKIIRLIHTQ